MIEIVVDAGYYGRDMYACMHTYVWGYSVFVNVAVVAFLRYCDYFVYILFVYVDFFLHRK